MTASSRPSVTYQTWGLPKNWNARHRGTRTKCPIVCNVVIDMPRCSALCNALQQATGELQGSLGSLRRARARETHQRYMQAREAVAGKPGLVVGRKGNLGAKQGANFVTGVANSFAGFKAFAVMNVFSNSAWA